MFPVWPFRKKKIKHRRLEVRKDISADRPSLWQRFRRSGALVSVLLALGFWLAVLLMDICPLDPLPYRQGQYVAGDIIARVDFRVLSRKDLEEQVGIARESRPATFNADENRIDEIVSILRSLPGRLEATTQPADLTDELRTRFALDAESLAAWRAMIGPQGAEELDKITAALKASMLGTAIISREEFEQQKSRQAGKVKLSGAGKSQTPEKTELIQQGDTARIAAAAARLARKSADGPLTDSIQTFLTAELGASTLFAYDEAATLEDMAQAERDIRANPPTEVYNQHKSGEILVDRGEILVDRSEPAGDPNKPLDAVELEELGHEHAEWLKGRSIAEIWARATGRAVQILLVILLLCAYITRYENRIVENYFRGLAIVVVLVVMLAISRIMISILGWNPHSAILTVVMISCVMSITYDQRFAMMIGTLLAVLVTFQLRGDFGMLIVMISGVMPCVFLLNEVRTRSKLIEVSAISAAVVFIAVWARNWSGQVPWNFALVDGLWAAGFALLAGFLVQGVLPLIERAFRVATSMTLLEWCDASKPLLRRLAMQAPGTYNHSLQLGAMCEAAAEAVGARGLLARVGAYYHDIGKTRKPEYFVENQGAMPSKHEKLSPAMSLLIIIGHVKDGIEMAKEYNLPTVLHEFIATHHGTTLVQHFYDEATRQRTSETDRAPDEVEFRYPGPKPSSKESGSLLRADGA